MFSVPGHQLPDLDDAGDIPRLLDEPVALTDPGATHEDVVEREASPTVVEVHVVPPDDALLFETLDPVPDGVCRHVELLGHLGRGVVASVALEQVEDSPVDLVEW